jgi:formate dehydrogenase major subunit
MAECHPVGFQWVMEAKARGAKVIHVDPRYSRTSAVSDLHIPIRAGSDIVLLGALINHVISNGLEFRDYVVNYTNAATLVSDRFQDTEDLEGLFSGYDPESRTYDLTSWAYEGTEAEQDDPDSETTEEAQESQSSHDQGSHGPAVEHQEQAPSDPTLEHPRCVFQVLKRHFARYTPEMVQESCGITPDQFRALADAWVGNSGRERTTALCYAVGWTHHSTGVQIIRAASILQLLLGNMGRPGGGILALRGHASIQGSTDIPTLFNLLPGYLPAPNAETHQTLDEYVSGITGDKQKGYWANARAYIVSLLKAYWGDAATPENDFCFDYLPRVDGDHGTYQQVLDMVDGKISGYFLLGQNPAVGSAHGKLQRLGMANLDWMVVRDLNMIESATFWKDSPEVETGEIVPEECRTEVFFLPAATHVEKAGTFTQTQRLLQWREKAVEPPGDARPELQFIFQLGRILRERLADSEDARDRPLLDLTWDYPVHGEHDEPEAEDVLREINGYDLTTGELLGSFAQMRDDGTTSGGCWIYTGVYKDGVNQSARRKPGKDQNWVASEWGWAWPADRRVLYNRASADPDGKPWSERKALVWWDESAGEDGKGRWVGHDVPDFQVDKAPSYRPPEGATGVDALTGIDPFIMQADGKGWLYAPSGLMDGPMPTHYEPHESPFRNPVHHQQANPTRQVFEREENLSNPSPPEPGSELFPYVFTTYRLTEHHTAGAMSRTLPFLAELQPEFFCEVSPELARERGLEHLGWATIVSARTAIEARVLVTERMKPLTVQGRAVQQIGLPYHWGQTGLSTGDAANDLIGIALDPNVHIQESKVASCDIQPGRRPRGPELLAYVADYQARAGITTATGNVGLTPHPGDPVTEGKGR